MKKNRGLRIKLLFTTTIVVIALALILVLVMNYFMTSLTDNLLLDTLKPMAKTASQSAEGNLHILADRIFMIRDNAALLDEASTLEDKQAILDKAKSGIEFVWIGLYSKDGTLLTGSNGSPKSIAGGNLYSNMTDTVNLAIDNTSINEDTGQLEIIIGSPITKRVGEDTVIAAYLAGSYKYDVLNDVLSNINIGSNGTAFIIDSEGRYMAHREYENVHGNKTIWDHYGSSEELKSLHKDMVEGKTGAASVNTLSGEAYFCFSPVRGTNWTLAITAPRSDFMLAKQQASTTSLIITVCLLVLFTLIFNLFIKKTLTGPLQMITENAKGLGKGRTDLLLSEKLKNRNDEIGRLAEAFFEMAGAIRNLISDTHMLVAATQEGQLLVRADASKHEGDYHTIIAGINQTVDLLVGPINEVVDVLGEMERGNLGIRIESEYQGDFLILKNSVNTTLSALQGYIFEVSEKLQAMAAGDLSRSIEQDFHGEFVALKDAINSISVSLSRVLREIDESAEQVAAGTEKVAISAQESSRGAMDQEVSIKELIDAVSGIAGQTKGMAKNANETNTIMAKAKQYVEHGRKSMGSMQTAMQEINSSSANISKIIGVIDDIAFQTNILALNAAVEASRAGEHGKGFAVVAQEVRNLAAKSAAAAKDTTELIEGSMGKAQSGTAIANETSGSLQDIVESVDTVSGIIGRIASASNDQAFDIEQVNKEISQLSQVVQMNSCNAYSTADEAEMIAKHAAHLKRLVSRFKLNQSVNGGGGRPMHALPNPNSKYEN